MMRIADEVEDVVELAALDDHLLVEAPEVLAATGDLGVDADLGERARTSAIAAARYTSRSGERR